MTQVNEFIRVGQINDKTVEIVELDNENKPTVIYSSPNLDTLPVCSKGEYVFFNSIGLSIGNLKEKTFINLNETGSYFVGGFFKNKSLVYYNRQQNEESELEIVLYNYEKKEIEKVLVGFHPSLSIKDDFLYFMRAEIDTSKAEIEYLRHIYKYSSQTDEVSLVTTLVLSEHGKYDITDVVAVSENEYYYRVYDEHEYRYYSDWTGEEKMFYSGGHGHFLDANNKEQYDLCFSSDMKFAAFAERNWNELTYIVVVDLEKGKRYELDSYGSFPYFHGQRLYFISDPEIINTKDVSFRQVQDYALYYLDLNDMEAKLALDFEFGIQIIK